MGSRVAGKVALVTGGASGLGLAAASRLADEGARVYLADINQGLGEQAVGSIANSSFIQLDVSSEDAWEAVVDGIIAESGRLDVLVNSAGIVELASIEDTTHDIWRRVHGVGTDGSFFGCKHALRVMKPNRSGSIINMCSTASIMGGPRIFAYCASKHAIRGITKSVATLCAQQGYGVRCNSVHPGNIETPMLQRARDAAEKSAPGSSKAMDKVWVGEPADIANMILFLASDESRSVNGAALVVDNTTTITEGVVPRHEMNE